jgi:hypothetical protein
MSSKWSPFRLPPPARWLKWPFLGLSGNGTAAGVWLLEEPLVVAGEIRLPLAALSGKNAIVYGSYHGVFQTIAPRRRQCHYRLPKRS